MSSLKVGHWVAQTWPFFWQITWNYRFCPLTGKYLSEALLFAKHGENMLCRKIVLSVRNNFCTQHFLPRFELGIFMYWTCNSMNNLLPYCELVNAKIRASDKNLPVLYFQGIFSFKQALHLCRVLQTLLFIIILIVSWWRKYSLTKNDLPLIWQI